MLYYQGYTVSFQEVPDEITLVLLVGDCPHQCEGCHSPELRKAEGKDLELCLDDLINEYQDILTCVCLMGEGRDDKALIRCANMIRDHGLKSAIYIGSGEKKGLELALWFDYVKYGPYVQELGGLKSPSTNQHMIQVTGRTYNSIGKPTGIDFLDITYKFQKNYLR